MLSTQQIETLRSELQGWFAVHQRDLAWRRTRDPYAIWISEVMLQQTRVAAVVPFYERFLCRFPTVQHLAEAPEDDLLTHWAGLGYYYRARNLHKAAREVCQRASFPSTYNEIQRLPGVGDYTAAAVASIAFNLPHAVLDGNVFRVLSRVFNDTTNIASSAGRKHFAQLADRLLDRDNPGQFNQAIMELGATICLPKTPQCLLCPIHDLCEATRTGTQNALPVKIGPRKTVEATRTLLWIERDEHILAWQRPPDARFMPGFWELPELTHFPHIVPGKELGKFRHGITFHNYLFRILQAAAPPDVALCQWLAIANISDMPVSTVLRKAFRNVVKHRQGKEPARRLAASSG